MGNRASFNPSLSSDATHGSDGPNGCPAKPFLCMPMMGKMCWSLGGENIKTKADSTVTSDLKPLQSDQCEDVASTHRAFTHLVCTNGDKWMEKVGSLRKEWAKGAKQKDS